MGAPGLDYRPCGACGTLVDGQDGCKHWKPGAAASKRRGWIKGTARATNPPPHPDSDEVARRTVAVLTQGGLTAR